MNPNIHKTYGTFVFLIIPLLIYSLWSDWRVLAIVILWQLDNVYTRLRMTIPIALFLLTNDEKSLPYLALFKKHANPCSIPTLVLDKDGDIPKEVVVQQDLVRVESDEDWMKTVWLVSTYCPCIIVETHSFSDALSQEMELIKNSDLTQKVFFVGRDTYSPEFDEVIRAVQQKQDRKVVLSAQEIGHLLSEQRIRMFGK